MTDAAKGALDRAEAADDPRTLDSWKEIADFLTVSVRTARRWRDTAGMPVHRTPAGHVWAKPDDLERWRRRLDAESPGPGRKILRTVGVLIAVATVVVTAGLWLVNRAGPPATVRINDQQIEALDRSGKTAWTAALPQLLSSSNEWGWEVSTSDRFLVDDIDDDGRVEVVFNLLPEDAAQGPGRLICYDDTGRTRWEFVLGRAFRDRYGDYSLDYLGHIVRPVRAGTRPLVLSAATHRRWHPAQVALLDPVTGRIVEQFWHPGAITHALAADVDEDGQLELVLAGLNNPGSGPGNPVLMTLELPFSGHPTVPDSLLSDMSDGGPQAYALLPRPDVLEAVGGTAGVSHLAFEKPGTILARVRVSKDAATNLTFRLAADLRVTAVFFSPDVPALHDTLWKAGALSHRFTPEERDWLGTVRHLSFIPDGNVDRIPPFSPAR